MKKIVHTLYLRTDHKYGVNERSDFSCPFITSIWKFILRWTHIWTLRHPVVFVNTGYFGASIRNESLSSQDVATAQSPVRVAMNSQEKFRLAGILLWTAGLCNLSLLPRKKHQWRKLIFDFVIFFLIMICLTNTNYWKGSLLLSSKGSLLLSSKSQNRLCRWKAEMLVRKITFLSSVLPCELHRAFKICF